jgi:saccharopine dehydrogenase-like NADP-dependent oxidoreductase
MKNCVVVGAGMIGSTIVDLLAASGDYKLKLIDRDPHCLDQAVHDIPNVEPVVLDINDAEALKSACDGAYAVLNAGPFVNNQQISKAAADVGAHYLGLTEDVKSTREIQELARTMNTAFIPQCGLAPGFISIAAYDLASGFDHIQNLHMRVGALPLYPSNALKYNLTWSTDGLINEYLNPCEAIVRGEFKEVPPLEELEHFSLDGVNYEAFNTSGGLGSLCETLKEKVFNLNYRTVRYPGHRDIVKLLVNDLGLSENRELLKQLLESAIPITLQDVVLVFVNVNGEKQGRFIQESFARKIYSQRINGRHRSAIQITTAAGICAALDLLVEDVLPQRGYVRQEDIPFADFKTNRFGQFYFPEVSYPDHGRSRVAA